MTSTCCFPARRRCLLEHNAVVALGVGSGSGCLGITCDSGHLRARIPENNAKRPAARIIPLLIAPRHVLAGRRLPKRPHMKTGPCTGNISDAFIIESMRLHADGSLLICRSFSPEVFPANEGNGLQIPRSRERG